MNQEGIKVILKKLNIKYIIISLFISIAIGVGYIASKFWIMMSFLKSQPERLLANIADYYGYTSDISKIQLLSYYREGSDKLGYQIMEMVTHKAIMAFVLGIGMGILIIVINKFFKKYIKLGIGAVIVVGILNVVDVYLVKPLNFYEIEERMQEMAREEERKKEEEKRLKETDPTTFKATFRGCDLEEIKKLVEGYGLGANVKDDDGNTVLAVVASMLEYNSDANKIVQYLLEQGADPDVMYEGQSALYYAAKADADCIDDLLVAGADPNKVNEDGDTPIRVAIDEYAIAAVGSLLYHHADVTKPSRDGVVPYDLALERLDYDSTLALFVFETVYMYYEGDGVDLHKYYDNKEKLEGLIEAGVDINQVDASLGDTLLHRAAKDLDLELCEFLLENDIDATIRNLEGRTAREVIGQNKYTIEDEENAKVEEIFDQYNVASNAVDINLVIDEELNLAPSIEKELIDILRDWYEPFSTGEIEVMLVLEPTESIQHRGRIGLVFETMRGEIPDWEAEFERLKEMISDSSVGYLIYIDKETGEIL